MSQSLNGRGYGGGNGTSNPVHQLKKKAFEPFQPTPVAAAMESQAVFRTAGGVVLQGVPLRVLRHTTTFELFNPSVVPQLSEALEEFKITLRGRVVYSGRAVVDNLVDAGTKIICEAALDEAQWTHSHYTAGQFGKEIIRSEFNEFVQGWQEVYRVNGEYKVAVADLQTYLNDLRVWLEHVELGIRSSAPADRPKLEADIYHSLRDSIISSLNSLFERFEVVSDALEEDSLAAHRAFGKRLLHPLMLSSPFLHRTYTKPLDYAGDYEMMNMIVRNGMEGSSLFAKFINTHLLDQPPCRAVRNRVKFLNNKIIEEVSRTARAGKAANIFCVACGPAWEAADFIAEHPLANRAQFELLDFNEETIQHTARKIEAVKRKHQRGTKVKMVKNSVQNLLRAGGRTGSKEAAFDLIYCSGLYDYLSERVCLALNTYLYDLLEPGGLLVVGNFAPWTPGQNLMEHLMDWFLIYRDAKQILELAPEQADREHCLVRAEPAGANIFLEVRKPK